MQLQGILACLIPLLQLFCRNFAIFIAPYRLDSTFSIERKTENITSERAEHLFPFSSVIFYLCPFPCAVFWSIGIFFYQLSFLSILFDQLTLYHLNLLLDIFLLTSMKLLKQSDPFKKQKIARNLMCHLTGVFPSYKREGEEEHSSNENPFTCIDKS